jgi:antitoxin HicB
MASVSPPDIQGYMQLPYRMEIYDDDGYWAAEFPDLPGLVAGHETWEGLQAAITDAKRAYFEAAIASGQPIPEPKRQEQFSGRFVLRLPKSLHRQAVQAAQSEGTSLNTFVVTAIAKELGRLTAPTQVAALGASAGKLGIAD